MKKGKVLFGLILSSMLLGGCWLNTSKNSSKTSSSSKPESSQSTEGSSESKKALTSISVHGAKTTYEYNSEFEKPGVTATFSDSTTAEVGPDCEYEGFDSKVAGQKTISVAYTFESVTKADSYIIIVKPEVIVFSSLELSNVKNTYAYGEEFVKPTVTAKFTNNTSKDVTSECTFTGFNNLLAEKQTITVSYTFKNEAHTATYDVTVAEPTVRLSSIAVSGQKTVYKVGDSFVTPTVLATFTDDSVVDVTKEATFTGFDSTAAGTCTVTASYTNYKDTKTASYSVTIEAVAVQTKFAIFADVQLCAAEVKKEGDPAQVIANANFGTTANAPIALKNHLEFCKKEGIKTILMNGDITNQANEYYYQHFESIFKEVYGTNEADYPELVWNMGNHEWWWGTTEQETGDAVTMFKKYARINSTNLVDSSEVAYSKNSEQTIPSYYKVIDGVPFIVISAESSAGNVGSALKAEIEGWLGAAKKLDTVKAGGPIFVEYHYPLTSSMTHGQGSDENRCATVEEIFKDTPNAVIFTGDTHYPGISERSINQTDFTTINLGSSSYSRMVNASATVCEDYYNVTGSGSKIGDKLNGNAKFNEAYTPTIQIVEVKENSSFTIDRYFSEDGGNASHVGPTWNFSPIKSKADFKYTNDRFENTKSAQALYKADGLSWETNDAVRFSVNDETHIATVLFPDVKDFHCVEHYAIKINDTTYDCVSNYYKNPKAKTSNYFILEDVPQAGTYSIEVIAYDFFDNPSLNKLTSAEQDATAAVERLDYEVTKGYSDIQYRNNFDDVKEGSSSSLEYYYKGIQTYAAGATTNRMIDTGSNEVATDIYTFDDATNDKPTLQVSAKVTTTDDLKLGVTVVNSEGTWKTDFGAEYQLTVEADNEWHDISWDLKTLFGITKISDLQMLQIKVKSTAASTSGYEMGVLLDNLDIVNGSSVTPPSAERGVTFTAGEDYSKNLDQIPVATGKITIDIKITSAGASDKVSICLGDGAQGWKNYFGYYNFDKASKTGDEDGITILNTSDGYMRIVFNLSQLTKHNEETGATVPTQISLVYVRGGWTTANGRIDIEPTADVEIIRGSKFEAGVNWSKDIDEKTIATDSIVVDIKFDDPSKHVNIMLGDGWNDYFGYYEITPSTKTGDFAGITVSVLEDGYIRFTFKLSDLAKSSGNPSKVNLVYFRWDWTDASGYVDIDNISASNPVRGDSFTGGNNYDLALSKDYAIAADSIIIDIKFKSADAKLAIALLEVDGGSWGCYFGYYSVTSATKTGDFNGLTVETLPDGYMKFTFELSKLTKLNHGESNVAPSKVNYIYIRGGWSTGNAMVDVITK